MTTQTEKAQQDTAAQNQASIADGVDAEIYTSNQRKPVGLAAKIAVKKSRKGRGNRREK